LKDAKSAFGLLAQGGKTVLPIAKSDVAREVHQPDMVEQVADVGWDVRSAKAGGYQKFVPIETKMDSNND